MGPAMRFFVLVRTPTFDQSSAIADVYPLGDTRGEAPRCGACGDFIGALSWLPPYRVELEALGTEFPEVVDVPGDDMLVAERFRGLYEDHEMVGLSGFDPVEVVRVKRRKKSLQGDPPVYYRVSVARSGAAVDDAPSGIDREGAVCPICRQARLIKRAKRIILESGTWTGEDIFIARGLSGTFLTTERFRDFCEENRVVNAVFVPAEEYAFDFYPLERMGAAE